MNKQEHREEAERLLEETSSKAGGYERRHLLAMQAIAHAVLALPSAAQSRKQAADIEGETA